MGEKCLSSGPVMLYLHADVSFVVHIHERKKALNDDYIQFEATSTAFEHEESSYLVKGKSC